ncbi:MAG: serine/threonine-protein kinase, partial [Gemmatimonadaceae bacterium]
MRISADNWRRLEPLLDAALDLTGSPRDNFIIEASGVDVNDIALLKRLVQECEKSDSRLDGVALDHFSPSFKSAHSERDGSAQLPNVLATRYRIEKEVGRGGMAIVYLARDLTHDREVAVKVMRASFHNGFGSARFLSEIRNTARLRHPHIVPVHDSGDADGVLFFVMPYFGDDTLADRLRVQSKLPVAEALRVANDVASALEYAHASGLVHRDIKPSNVLFSSGHALLADFGIARAVEPQESMTASGVVIGTPGYMSPEQLSGSRDVDARSDIYSLGCMLYEMLAGETPASADTREALSRHAINAVPPLSASHPDVRQVLQVCVNRAMELVPENRYQSAGELLIALQECARVNAVAEMSTKTPARVIGARRRMQAFGAVAAVVMVLALVWVGWPKPKDPTDVRVTAPGFADSTRIVLLPFTNDSIAPKVLRASDQMRDVMSSWSDIAIVDQGRVAEELSTLGSRAVRASDERAIAQKLGAGRYVRRAFVEKSDTLYAIATLFDARSGEIVRDGSALVNKETNQADSSLTVLANALIFSDVPIESLRRREISTRNREAWKAFVRGSNAIREWNLLLADSAFASALRADFDFAPAGVWLAQVRVWQQRSDATWQHEVAHALDGKTKLTPSEVRIAEILQMQASGDTGGACAAWVKLT